MSPTDATAPSTRKRKFFLRVTTCRGSSWMNLLRSVRCFSAALSHGRGNGSLCKALHFGLVQKG